MHGPKGRSRDELALVLERLEKDRRLVPVANLRHLLNVPIATIERWIQWGYRGVYLDGKPRDDGTWLTSREAIQRFIQDREQLLAREGVGENKDPPPSG